MMEKEEKKLRVSKDEVALLGGEYVVVTKKKPGTLFIEARIRDNVEEEMDTAKIQEHLEDQLSRPNQFFHLFADLLVDSYNAKLLLGPLYEHSHALQSLKVVDYIGPNSEINSYSSDNVQIKVQVYQLYHTRRSSEEPEGLPQADITPLPHIRFDGQWDALFFETDIKGDLIWMVTNMLRFSQTSGGEPADTSSLILLHGPPGTGKTTLCQGLAQKISIRLNSVYKRTSLIQIKAAALLSKYYSESARQVDKIFTTLQQMCEDDPEEFICVLIDEVETIAITREASAHGESQESLRATNAFLTGLDRTKGYPNIAFLCTSNMATSLDAAFLDRCGLKLAIEPPSLASQYAILCGRIQKLITRGIIHSETVLPSYRDAEVDRNVDTELPGAKLLHMIELLNTAALEHTVGTISGRSLTQLPEQALLRYLREGHCDLDMALRSMVQYVRAEQSRAMIEDFEIGAKNCSTEEILLGLRKRKGAAMSKENDDIDRALGAMGDLIAELREKRQRVSPQSANELLDS